MAEASALCYFQLTSLRAPCCAVMRGWAGRGRGAVDVVSGKFQIPVCLAPKPGLPLLSFLSILGRSHCPGIQQISVEHQLYASLMLGVARMTAGNQTDTLRVPALMELSQVHLPATDLRSGPGARDFWEV